MVILFFIGLITHLLLVFRVDEGFLLQFSLVLVFIMGAVVALVGIYFGELWSLRIAMIVFAAMIANILFVMSETEGFALYITSLAASTLGFLLSVYNIRAYSKGEKHDIIPAAKGDVVIETKFVNVPKPTDEAVEEIRREESVDVKKEIKKARAELKKAKKKAKKKPKKKAKKKAAKKKPKKKGKKKTKKKKK
jgi:outer membrane biosynthesis protein TonB